MSQPRRSRDVPDIEKELTPEADDGEDSYKACDKLTGKAATADITVSLGPLPADKAIRVNSVAPGPIWT